MAESEREKLVAKIRKLMALAASTGSEHEAATALEKAQALMAEHAVTHDDVAATDVSEARAAYSGNETLTSWESRLMSAIGQTFGCDSVFHPRVGEVSFVGPDPGPELASYAFDVLRRQCLSARRSFMATALKRVKVRANKTRRADLYCDGWTETAVSKCLPVTKSAEQMAAITAYKRRAWGELTSLDARDRSKDRDLRQYELRDRQAGRSDGRAAELRGGVGQGVATRRLACTS